MKSSRLLFAALCVVPTACTTAGGGRAGIVLLDPNQHVSGSAPLFGTYEDQCFNYPTYGLAFTRPGIDISGFPAVCQKIATDVRIALGAPQTAATTGTVEAVVPVASPVETKKTKGGQKVVHPVLPAPPSGTVTYSKEVRNEIIESFVSSSNAICADHIRFLAQWDGNINSTLGLGSEASAGLAAIVNGTAARIAAATAAFLGSARGTNPSTDLMVVPLTKDCRVEMRFYGEITDKALAKLTRYIELMQEDWTEQ